jgi:hypothetical protein
MRIRLRVIFDPAYMSKSWHYVSRLIPAGLVLGAFILWLLALSR